MCGLFFAYSLQSNIDTKVLDSMLRDLRHRGPDATGRFSCKSKSGIYLDFAHARLKIIDLQDRSNQPMISVDNRWLIIFNGEIYNYKKIQQEIGNRWDWVTGSDTEVIIAAWSIWGKESLNKFVGMFVFILWDRALDHIHICRDRFGIKPLYYLKNNSGYYFASEIPPLLKCLEGVEPNMSVLSKYLQVGDYESGGNTFFDGIYSVKPGHYIKINLTNSCVSELKWYDLAASVADKKYSKYEDCLEETSYLLDDAIDLHSISDVSIGVNLSGGTDSALLADYYLKKNFKVNFYSQLYDGNYSELELVNIATYLDIDQVNLVRLNSEDVLNLLRDTVKSQCEPFGGVTVCGYDSLYKMASRQGVKVLLDGNGIDETFLGYKKYYNQYIRELKGIPTQEKVANYQLAWNENPTIDFQSHQANDGTFSSCLNLISPALRSFYEGGVEPYHDGVNVKDIAISDLLTYKIPRALRFNDRVSMKHSVELRTPFLDHRLVEHGLSLPMEYLLTSKGGKGIIRDVLYRKTNNAQIAYSPKKSIQSPQNDWFRDEWVRFTKKIIESDSFKARGWFESHKVCKAYNDYVNGNSQNSFFLWQIINTELWAREFFR